MRVAIMQRMVCHYQMPYYHMLKEDLENHGVDLKVFCGIVEDKEHSDDGIALQRLRRVEFNVRVGGLHEKLVLLPTLFWAFVKYKPHVIVAEDISAMPNCITVFVYSKLFRIPYIIRGMGSIPGKEPSKLRPFLLPFIKLYRKSATAFLCYSSYAKNYYFTRYQKPCYVDHNSTTLQHSKAKYKEIESNIYRKYKNSGQSRFNIVFIGRLIPQKRVDLLLHAISEVAEDIPIAARIIGDGTIKNELVELSKRLKIDDKVRFLGQITDNGKKREFFMDAHLGVLPGLGGLAIQEMMWYGIPVVASLADGTERDLIVEGKAGIFVKEMNVKELAKSVDAFFRMDYEEKTELALNALKVVYEKYNLSSMVSAFRESVIDNTGNILTN